MLDGMELLSYHHTLEDISESLFQNRFAIERILESRAADHLKKKNKRFHERTNTYPSFCGFRARKTV